MKIFRMAGNVEEFPESMPKVESEAIRLKDGRVFFTQSINHWVIYNYLKFRKIGIESFDAIGWLSPDGAFLSKAKGNNAIKAYMAEGNWSL